MTNNFENEIWESLLRAAVIKNCLDELESYSPRKIEETILPAAYDYKMRKLMRHLHFRSTVRTSLHYIRKTAAILFILIGIGFVFLLRFDEVRAACHNVITHIYEKYIQFYFNADLDTEINPVELEYIPDGFTLSEETLSESGYNVIYYDSQGGMLFFRATPYEYIAQADHEHYEIREVTVGHYGGQFFSSVDDRFPNMLYWQTETDYCYLQAALPEEEMIKIAENVK